MRVHALQTGTVTIKSLQPEGKGRARTRAVRTMLDRAWTEPLPIIAWLIEHPDGPLLVDTGATADFMRKDYAPRWHPYFRLAVRFDVKAEDEIERRLRERGIAPDDIRTVVLTHLHSDHVGGVGFFPQSEVLVTRTEWERAQGLGGKILGYLSDHFPQWLEPTLVDFGGDPYGPFAASRVVADGVRLVPTPGHTPGHLSVIVEDGGRTLFLAGDVTYGIDLLHRGAVDGLTDDPKTAAETVAKVKAFVDERGAEYLPTHDPASAARVVA
jgi:glyoxylase-like metal-dependent hydrolase (beta-lactamase superfamily II)